MSLRKKILLIEDEEDIASLINLHAGMYGYKLFVATCGTSGLKVCEKEKPDLILLDIMLPGENGFDICKKIKGHSELKNIPVIMLTAKGEEIDIVLGLELGADDYILKPFSPKILFSRIKAVLRRDKEEKKDSSLLSFADCTLNVEQYLLKKRDKPITLTLSEFNILKRLVMHTGKVLTRNQLLEDIHDDEESSVVDRNIDVHIASLRKKLGPNFSHIETVRGVGYRFLEEVEESSS